LLDAAGRELTPDLPKRALATDLSLHGALAGGFGNPFAAEAYRVNRDRIAVIQNTRPFLPDRIVSAIEEHAGIIDALERRDEAAAVAAIRAHYHTTLRW
jgi:DNA-binding GntR family transcriptional regulator